MGKTTIAATGWLLALVLSIGLIGLYIGNSATIRTLEGDISALQQELGSARKAIERLSELERQQASLAPPVADTHAEDTAVNRMETEVPDDFDPSKLIKSMLGDGAQKKSTSNPLTAMFEGEQGEKMVKASIGMTLNMQYRDLFTALNLSEEREEALRDVLKAHLEANALAGVAAMRGESNEADLTMTQSEEDLLAAVAEVLTPEELTEFEQYQTEIPERMMRQQYEMQLNMLAPNLGEEARQYTLDVLVDTILPTAEEASQVGFDGLAGNMEQMRGRFEEAAARLEEDLAPEDAKQVRAFIDQQILGIEMMAGMLNGNDDEEEPAE